MIVREVRVRRALTRSGLPDIDYALNPYIGCSHGCIYCYARLYTDRAEVRERWGEVVLVKVNLVELLRREATSVRGVVGVGTVTDPYQPVEKEYGLTRESLRVLLRRGLRASIQTKSGLVARDKDILVEYRGSVDVGFTITTLDERVARWLEPGAPPPRERVRALEGLSSEGIRTWVFYGPVIPGVNDGDDVVEGLLKLAASTGSVLYYDSLHVKPFMLTPSHPLREAALSARRYNWGRFWRRLRESCEKFGVICREGFTGDAVANRGGGLMRWVRGTE